MMRKRNRFFNLQAESRGRLFADQQAFYGHCGAYLCGESGTSRSGTVHHYYKMRNCEEKAWGLPQKDGLQAMDRVFGGQCNNVNAD